MSLRDFASFESSRVKIGQTVLSCGLFPPKRYVCMYVKIIQRYISPICPEAPPWKDLHLNWHSGSSHGHNQLWQFFLQSVLGFGFCSGPKFTVSHWLSQSPLIQCCRYHAARDAWCHQLLGRQELCAKDGFSRCTKVSVVGRKSCVER